MEEYAVRQAIEAVNNSQSILPGINLGLITQNVECSPELVLNAFIVHLQIKSVLAVLGPACSETINPIAGKWMYFLNCCNVVCIFSSKNIEPLLK